MRSHGFKKHYSRASCGAGYRNPRGKAGGKPIFIRASLFQNLQNEAVPQSEIEALKRMAKDLEARLRSLNERLGQMDQRPAAVGFVALVDEEKCVGCGICIDNCPNGAIGLEQVARVDPQRCVGCGLCIEACPRGAIYLHPAERLKNRA